MSMQGLPSVPVSTGRVTDFSPALRVTSSKAGLFAGAVSDGTGRSSVMRTHGVDGHGGASLDANRGEPRKRPLSHSTPSRAACTKPGNANGRPEAAVGDNASDDYFAA